MYLSFREKQFKHKKTGANIMGWDGILISEPHKTVSEKLAVYFKYHGFCENEVVKATIKNGVVYGAIRNLKTGNVWAMISLLKFRKDGWQTEMLAKNMSEDMMPYYFDCPKSILDLLTNTDNENSLKWREKCREQLEKAKEKAKVKKTDYLFIKSGVKFANGDIHYVFVKNKYGRNRYHSISDSYTHYRFNPNDFEVQYITESQYVACETAYKQKFSAECVITDYDDNIISFEDAVKRTPKLTKERYDECLELAKKELCDLYQNIINSK